MQTQSEENYLKAIYLLGLDGKEKVSATSISQSMGNNPPSVIDMFKKLANKNLIEYDKVRGAKLTEVGLSVSLLTIRRHRLWELFLQKKLGYTWDEVHEIAEQLEHVQGEELADRLDKYLGYPKFDPHGEVIPNSKGQIPEIKVKTLNEVEVGSTCKVMSVKDTSKLFLQYLRKLNISIGVNIKVIERIEFDSSLVILIENGNNFTVSEKLTSCILVG